MKKLFTYLKDYKLQLILGPACKIIEAIFELIIPLVMASIIDKGINNNDIPYIINMGFVMIMLGAVGLTTTLICQKLASIASQGSGTQLRTALFSHINKLAFKDIDKFGTSSLITRMTNDINQLQLAVAMLIRLVIRAPFLVIGAMIMAFRINATISIVFFVASILIAVVLYLVMSKSIPHFKSIQKILDKLSLISRENLSGTRVVRAFNKEKYEEERFNNSTDEYTKTALRVGKLSALLNPATNIIANIAIVFIVWIGATLVNDGNMLSGEIVALVNYMTQILLALIVVAQLVIIFTKAFASASRVLEVLNTEPSIKDGEIKTTTHKDDTPQVSFKDVSFSYGGENVLHDINFDIFKGQTIGIIGTTGSGKSTLINLIPRFYECSKGSVLIDDTNVNNLTFNYIRKKCALVMQNPVLFSGTILENIRTGKKDATEDEVIKALKVAQAFDFVDKTPLKLNSIVLAGGKNFSGGQKQRLTIARAVVTNPDILILDDAASALDFATDKALRNAIKELSKNMTVIIVSQRVATVRDADKIAVLENGYLKGFDTHKTLVKTCNSYKEICLSQLSQSEVLS